MKKIAILIAMLMLISVNAYAEDPTPEQILQKVADNYGKIEDMSAVITSSGTVNTAQETTNYPEEVGTFMLKKPDKMKIITSQETVITDGNIMYTKEEGQPVKKIDLSGQTGIDISKLNFYYNLTVFKQGHTFSLKSSRIENGDTIYPIECVPKPETKASYGKLVLEINYSKGIDIRKVSYLRESDTKPQMKEEISGLELIDNVWVGTKVYEEHSVLDAVIKSWSKYSEIKLNTGISDGEFKP